MHYLISEHVSWWHRAWTNGVIGRLHARSLRLSDWTRYRLGRIASIVLVVAAVAIVAGAAWHTTPIDGLFQLPSRLYHALPFVFQIIAVLLLAVGQFAAIFWFLSRGGTDVYFPDDIKTRFSDVWGQDAVLEAGERDAGVPGRPGVHRGPGRLRAGGDPAVGAPRNRQDPDGRGGGGETGKPFVFVDPGAFINMFFGVGVLKVKSLFRKLRKLAVRYGGVIVFFDEADSLGNRGLLSARRDLWSGRRGGAQRRRPSWRPAHPRSLINGAVVTAGLPFSEQRLPAVKSAAAVDGMMPVMAGAGGGGGGMGTLQALLTELSGSEEAAGIHEPGRSPDPRAPAQAAAQVPDHGRHGDQHAPGPR